VDQQPGHAGRGALRRSGRALFRRSAQGRRPDSARSGRAQPGRRGPGGRRPAFHLCGVRPGGGQCRRRPGRARPQAGGTRGAAARQSRRVRFRPVRRDPRRRCGGAAQHPRAEARDRVQRAEQRGVSAGVRVRPGRPYPGRGYGSQPDPQLRGRRTRDRRLAVRGAAESLRANGAGSGRRGGDCRHPLYLRHDREAQGGDADPDVDGHLGITNSASASARPTAR